MTPFPDEANLAKTAELRIQIREKRKEQRHSLLIWFMLISLCWNPKGWPVVALAAVLGLFDFFDSRAGKADSAIVEKFKKGSERQAQLSPQQPYKHE